MEPKIFDSHAHYFDERFDGFRKDIMAKLPNNNVAYVINCGTDINTSKASLEFAEKYDFCYAAAGYHPENITDKTVFEEDVLLKFLSHPKAVALGEIGLDYYYSNEYKKYQKYFFERQLELSKKINKPVIIHDREAHADTLELLKKHHVSGVLHCFSGSKEFAGEILKLGMYIGIGGVITFKNSKKLREVAEYVPLDRILLETDAPYLAPEPMRGKLNTSDYIKYIADILSQIKGVSYDEIVYQTNINAKNLFSVK